MVQQKLLFEDGDHGLDRGRNSRRGFGVRQVHPALTEPKATKASLLGEVVQAETLDRAWAAVRRNRGGPGVDGMTVESFGSWWEANRQRIVDELRSGKYRPQPVKRCEIPKPKGGVVIVSYPFIFNSVGF